MFYAIQFEIGFNGPMLPKFFDMHDHKRGSAASDSIAKTPVFRSVRQAPHPDVDFH